MTHIQLETQGDKYLISIDKSIVDRKWLVDFIQKLRTEELANQFNFGEDVEALGEEIKAGWWAANKSRFIHE